MFKKIKGYSRGMKQRLGIAQALINNLSILLLDETTVGVDPKERFRFRKILSALSKIESSCYPLHIVSGVIAVKLARK